MLPTLTCHFLAEQMNATFCVLEKKNTPIHFLPNLAPSKNVGKQTDIFQNRFEMKFMLKLSPISKDLSQDVPLFPKRGILFMISPTYLFSLKS